MDLQPELANWGSLGHAREAHFSQCIEKVLKSLMILKFKLSIEQAVNRNLVTELFFSSTELKVGIKSLEIPNSINYLLTSSGLVKVQARTKQDL